MSLFEKIFPKQAVDIVTNQYFKTLTAYQPVFRSYGGGLYEAELCRASVHAFANHASKLRPVVNGARQDLQKILETQPNPYMDTTKFIYKVASILEVENTAFIVPLYDKYFQKVVGFYPVRPQQAELRERNGKPYIVFQFPRGEKAAMELDKVGIMNKFFYKDDFFGDNNNALNPTLSLLYTQKQGIEEGIKQNATIRFLGKLAQSLKPSDIEAERKRWNSSNLSIDNNGGIALFDAKYADVKQIESRPYAISASQMEAVQENVFNYFGVSKNVLQNKFSESEWAAFYEGKIEPFAVQLSLVLTNMLFTAEQKTRGNEIQFTANRLQYASTTEKLNVASQMMDRGVLNRNEAREIFNLPPIENGDQFIVRGEYYNADEKVNTEGNDEQ